MGDLKISLIAGEPVQGPERSGAPVVIVEGVDAHMNLIGIV